MRTQIDFQFEERNINDLCPAIDTVPSQGLLALFFVPNSFSHAFLPSESKISQKGILQYSIPGKDQNGAETWPCFNLIEPMGAEEAKQEEAQAAPKPEEKKEEKTEDKPKEEQTKEEPKPPSPFVLFVDLHCVGCTKKIEKSIMKIRGVEGVVTDMSKNQVTIKGVIEPQAVCTKIMKKTKRRAQVVSPLPAAEGKPLPEVVNSEVSGLTTVELTVNMHCEACAQQLKKKILKMRGVRTATTELSSGKVTVTGTMDANKLVDYVYRRTKKQAKIVPQPEPEKPAEAAEAKPEEKKEEAPAEDQKPAAAEESKPEEKKEGEAADAEKKEGGGEKAPEEEKKDGKEEKAKEEEVPNIVTDELAMQRAMYYYQPLYVIERIPPAPQLFSDENPNACCIT
ncbi:heavy metal-associated isoprenylated plant protein 9-like isoform X2 [Diospyros lotus]|uniref:heavy metal-associated isoprenylated plant protein 9-like isoform X2 n=1 Tax=Diospyros lotus TaxID=55363 RepID=UPI0022505259|nr:heavy metal-associated isoprenylated plant protein 9-like isoform X2 [Diospyros lotus]